ncbi:MAG: universal stress protein [Yoonia sp.]|nr:universal stress protein [Yoonia sp.]
MSFGKIHKKVLATIDKTEADLIIIGAPLPDRIREFLVGSNADRVVSRAPVSVLVVRG